MNMYGFEFVEGGAVLDLCVLLLVEEGGPESSDDGLSESALYGEGAHLHVLSNESDYDKIVLIQQINHDFQTE